MHAGGGNGTRATTAVQQPVGARNPLGRKAEQRRETEGQTTSNSGLSTQTIAGKEHP